MKIRSSNILSTEVSSEIQLVSLQNRGGLTHRSVHPFPKKTGLSPRHSPRSSQDNLITMDPREVVSGIALGHSRPPPSPAKVREVDLRFDQRLRSKDTSYSGSFGGVTEMFLDLASGGTCQLHVSLHLLFRSDCGCLEDPAGFKESLMPKVTTSM